MVEASDSANKQHNILIHKTHAGPCVSRCRLYHYKDTTSIRTTYTFSTVIPPPCFCRVRTSKPLIQHVAYHNLSSPPKRDISLQHPSTSRTYPTFLQIVKGSSARPAIHIRAVCERWRERVQNVLCTVVEGWLVYRFVVSKEWKRRCRCFSTLHAQARY
jgi:hypothetical protein